MRGRLLLLWIAVTAVSRTNCQVSAPASVTGYAGEPLVLGCNITLAAGDAVQQVRWLTKTSQLLLAYQLGPQVQISHQSPDVQLTWSGHNASAITIRGVQLADEGCYLCVFDVFPSGSQEGRTCVSVTGKVSAEGSKISVEGKPQSLSCRHSLPERVVQVLWRKAPQQGSVTTVASYSKDGYKVEDGFVGRFDVSRSLGVSRLTVQSVRREDEACYICEFHSFPDGTKQGSVCLSVYVLPRPEVTTTTLSPGVTEANCSARSWPEAKITWDLRGQNKTLGPPRLSVVDGGNGTKVVTSTLVLKSEILGEVWCVVQHPGLDDDLSVPLLQPEAPDLVVPLAVSAALVILVGICVCLCKCCICTND
ncbi:OX-2 membrane glycoprotein-like isoform X2 [Synchiropus splendidus]|uniref:OX-2 membrane glycoprotein-like isoform X2 n=1 Tax=Synchiropus splendidus TaxID=270530 RepID=UPI00237E0583|nr:OX-2 membrane glycoprotein-like isoform X2 [Synchiropus splendidus]